MSKHRVIVEAVLAGKSQREVARSYGVSQPRVSQLVKQWREGGWEALEPKSRRPLSNSRATSAYLVDVICDLRRHLVAEGCDAGPHTIAALEFIANGGDDYTDYFTPVIAVVRAVMVDVLVEALRADTGKSGSVKLPATDGCVTKVRWCAVPAGCVRMGWLCVFLWHSWFSLLPRRWSLERVPEMWQ